MLVGQQFLVDAGNVVIALQEGDGGHLDQVLEADGVVRQQGQVIAGVAAPTSLALGALAGGDVGLVADNGVEGQARTLAKELDGRRRGCRGP